MHCIYGDGADISGFELHTAIEALKKDSFEEPPRHGGMLDTLRLFWYHYVIHRISMRHAEHWYWYGCYESCAVLGGAVGKDGLSAYVNNGFISQDGNLSIYSV